MITTEVVEWTDPRVEALHTAPYLMISAVPERSSRALSVSSVERSHTTRLG